MSSLEKTAYGPQPPSSSTYWQEFFLRQLKAFRQESAGGRLLLIASIKNGNRLLIKLAKVWHIAKGNYGLLTRDHHLLEQTDKTLLLWTL
jgi:hypothetical protein